MSMASGIISKEEYARIREEARRAVANPSGVSEASLRSVAERYAAAAAGLNERLVRCSDWIARGLRSEAVHEASLPPDLSESMRALDLGAELSDFETLCAFHDIQLHYDMNWDLASQLDEAIAFEAEIHAAAVSYRRACVGRMDLLERKRRLSKLREQDPMNDVWVDAAGELDVARLRALGRKGNRMVDQRDVEGIESVLAELLEDGWSVEVPARMIRSLDSARHRLRTEQARESLPSLAAELARLHVEGANDDLLIQATERWEAAVAQTGGAVASEVHQVAASALDRASMVRRERQDALAHRRDCAILESAIDRGARPVELRAIVQSMRRGRDLPAELEIRLAEAIADARRRQIIFVGGIGGLILMGVLLLLVVLAVRTLAGAE